jgi:hypothetical protein
LGQVTLTLVLDPSNQVAVTRGGSPRLSLDFKMAASNIVNVAQKTVTVTPFISASASPIDAKTVHIRGPFAGINTANTAITSGVVPFDFSTAGPGQFTITPSTTTTYEINGTPSAGSAGLTQLASLSSGTMIAALGTMTSSTSSNGIASSLTSSVSFTATEVLAGSSVQGSGFDRLSGIVSGRSGNTLTVEDGTLLSNGGTNTFIPGTANINIGANTQVTETGQGGTFSAQQISVGSRIYAFGTASTPVSGNVTVDASAGRVRLGQSGASGVVTARGAAALTLNLASVGGRSVGAFDFVGTGAAPGNDASATGYQVATGSLDLTNATVGSPVEVTGLVAAFGAAPPDFSASTLLDVTTLNAQLVIDWSSGTVAPFAVFNSSEIDVSIAGTSGLIGPRAVIQVGAQTINVLSLASDPLIIPDQTNSNTVYTIGHTVSGTFESFVTFAAFITQLQTELNGSVLVTGITALGPYTSSTFTLSASSITLFLND